ncbi:hypothetical protein [Paracoccus caeni]|uniref:hypothetical protein n=1 Tax=Paracoccus caeni TaxID=657651 RepID=UPI00190D2C8D|nr:hypothetical protein [Paracoccus caeni]
MANRKSSFTQADVSRAIKGAQACGLPITRTLIEPNGTIIIHHDSSGESDNLTPFQKWKAEQDARAAKGH